MRGRWKGRSRKIAGHFSHTSMWDEYMGGSNVVCMGHVIFVSIVRDRERKCLCFSIALLFFHTQKGHSHKKVNHLLRYINVYIYIYNITIFLMI